MQFASANASWSDLNLSKSEIEALRKVHNQLDRDGCGLVLFSGSSGTEKTMAASVLSQELRKDFYRIDLSQIVSKYIGETEKNLDRIFAYGQDTGAILLFDEADSLFGKRSDVKDSHDRYANLEISYLLNRLESYRGIAILVTNQKTKMASVFKRRFGFIIEFSD